MTSGPKQRYSRNEFLYARPLAQALLNDPAFRMWFLADTKVAEFALNAQPEQKEQARLRTTPNSRKWFWFNYWCPKDRSCECRGIKGIETDILLVFKALYGIRFALHVEVKLPYEEFLPDQAESYLRRGRCWIDGARRPRTVPAHDDFVAVIVCGEELKSDYRLSNFDKTIFHNDVRQKISPYPDLIDHRDQPA